MERICGIYKITSPTGRVYIGQSVDIKRRIRVYRYPEQVKSQRKLYDSLNKYGYEKHKFETFNHADYKPKYLSKYTLVTFRKDSMKWRSFINVDGRTKSLGSFKTEKEAYEAQQKALKEYNL